MVGSNVGPHLYCVIAAAPAEQGLLRQNGSKAQGHRGDVNWIAEQADGEAHRVRAIVSPEREARDDQGEQGSASTYVDLTTAAAPTLRAPYKIEDPPFPPHPPPPTRPGGQGAELRSKGTLQQTGKPALCYGAPPVRRPRKVENGLRLGLRVPGVWLGYESISLRSTAPLSPSLLVIFPGCEPCWVLHGVSREQTVTYVLTMPYFCEAAWENSASVFDDIEADLAFLEKRG